MPVSAGQNSTWSSREVQYQSLSRRSKSDSESDRKRCVGRVRSGCARTHLEDEPIAIPDLTLRTNQCLVIISIFFSVCINNVLEEISFRKGNYKLIEYVVNPGLVYVDDIMVFGGYLEDI